MNVRFADNMSLHLTDVLIDNVQDADDVKFAVAFMKYSGLRLIEAALHRCLSRAGRVEFVVGLDFRTTDAMSLRAMNGMVKRHPNCYLYCYSDTSDDARAYHPKLYLMGKEQLLTAVVGSSNLTQGGLQGNVEINAVFQMERTTEHAETLFDVFAAIKHQPLRFAPDEDYIDAYEELATQMRVQSRQSSHNTNMQDALQLLRRKEQELPTASVSPRELGGWQRLVFDKLPSDEFSTDSLYRYVPEFQRVYPDNRNVEAKIRQVLQQLRDLGLITHRGQGRWLSQPPRIKEQIVESE